MDKNNKSVRTQLRLPADIYEILREKSYKEKVSLNSLIVQAVNNFVEKSKEKVK